MNTKNTKIHYKKKTERIFSPADNVFDLLNNYKNFGDRIAFSFFDNTKSVKELSFYDFYVMVMKIRKYFSDNNIKNKKIIIIGENSHYWLSVYLAAISSGNIVVPMDKDFTASQILSFSDMIDADIICYSRSVRKNTEENEEIKSRFSLMIPMFDEETNEEKIQPIDSIINSRTDDFEINLEEYSDNADENAPCEYLFTSGTTGSSKCVMLCQRNIFSNITCACAHTDFGPDDVLLSVLPMYHTYELTCSLAALNYGAKLCINDKISHVLRNIKLFKPTALVLVPLFVYNIHKKIWSEASKQNKLTKLKLGIILSGTLKATGIDIRKTVFKEVRETLGGNLEKIICGGAALNPLLIEAFNNFGISIYEGYGITECSPLVAVSPYYAVKYGSVGKPVNCCNVRIDPNSDKIGESGYITDEIQVKGENVMLGYYKNDKATDEAFTYDGWFKTGDVGYIDDDGYIFITGRQKSVIVLENGKNVFPEEIEEYLTEIEEIEECVVVGRGDFHSSVILTAVVYPCKALRDENISQSEIKDILMKKIMQVNQKLPSFKRLSDVEIRDEEFEKTNSKKIKRYLVK